jgi:xanthine phosphoribosyltransferase
MDHILMNNDENQKVYVSYSNFKYDILQLARKIRSHKIDSIVGVSRGGLTITHFLSEFLDVRDVHSISSILYDDDKKLENIEIFNLPTFRENVSTVLIIDEIVDSGKTMSEILKVLNQKYPNIKFLFATIFLKSSASEQPDFYVHKTNKWIEFFWSKDLEELKTNFK